MHASPSNAMPSAADLVARLQLQPHPEGGWYRETWRGPSVAGRSTATTILYLLERGQRSHWHRIDASEIWLHQGGAAMRLSTADDAGIQRHRLAGDLAPGSVLQAVVEAGEWQSAEPEGDWSLVACVVAPGFEFSGFELAPEGWEPGQAGR